MAEYAIIKSGNKQYQVKRGDVIDVELLGSEKEGKIEFTDVLFFRDEKDEIKIGTPMIPSAKVYAEVLDQVRGPKVIAYKYKKRKSYHRKKGHRQNYTRVKITEFSL